MADTQKVLLRLGHALAMLFLPHKIGEPVVGRVNPVHCLSTKRHPVMSHVIDLLLSQRTNTPFANSFPWRLDS